MIAVMLRGIQSRAGASAWIRSPIGKVKPIRYVVVTCLQRRGEAGRRDVERSPDIHYSVA
jgi:hypothetical protein